MDYTKRVLPDLPTTNGDSREYRALIPTEDNPSDSEFLSNLSGEGIYDVPRSVLAPYGGKIVIGDLPGIYDHPHRQFINLREDEGVYISPNEDNEDEDIYVYPPDALNDHMLLTQEEALQSLGVYDYPKVSRASTVSSSASTYRDSTLSESTLRNSSASYVTIHESQGQSIPQFTDGTAFMNGNAGNGEVKFSAGELSELMNPASRASQAIEEGLYDRPKSLWSSTTEELEIEPLDTMAGGIKGYLYRKERFQWTKMLCCIKNNRFECYKGNTIALKLFLPGAEVFPDQEAKRPYALKIKHPRKETTLQFAAEGEMQFKMWLSAFIKAASISVQSVNDVEQIRVVDSAMKEKWKNLEGSQLGSTKDKKRLVKASTVSTMDAADKAGDDSTLQRKKKLTDRIAKGMFSGKRKKKSSDHTRAETRSPVSPKPSHSNEDLLASSDTEPVEGAMKRSLSLDTVIATHSPINSPKHKSFKQKRATEKKNTLDIPTSNASYLLVQQTRMQGAQAWVRYWSVLDNLIINFYPSRMDVGSHFKIGLRGSRVSRATQETQRPLSFMIWHLDSGNRVFCVAENETEFISWFEILTNGSEHVVPSIQDNIRRSASFYYFPSDYTLKVENQANQLDQLSGSEHTLTVSQDPLSSQFSLNSSQENVDFGGSTNSLSSLGSAVQYAGILKHKNSSDSWVEYNCMIRKSSLYMFRNPTDKTPVTAVVLPKCQVAKTEDPTEEHVFTVLEYESKTPHVFAVPSGSELPHWLSKIQECREDRLSLHELRRMKQWLSTEDLSENQKRKQYRSAEDLPAITSPDNIHLKTMSLQRPTNKDINAARTYSGFIEVLIKGSSWSIYWCTVKDGSLHLYETQQSDLPLRSFRLFKYTVQTDSSQLKRPYCLILTYQSSSPIYISLTDNLEKQKWLQVLLRATQVDAVMPHSEKDSISSYESGNAKLSDSHGSALDQCGETPENTLERKRRRVLKQYERNMKKTHKFSKQTTDSLKREKRGLVAMKEQIAPHLEKLEGLAANGDERAKEKFVTLQIKVKQIDAVLPYLEKCIMKNKEAEQKTIAILEKKRDEELASLEKGSPTIDSPTERSECDRKNSTSDLYMKVLAENGDIGENPHLSEAFAGIPETNDNIHHTVPLHEDHIDIMNSTPIKPNGPSISVENVMNDSIIHTHDHQEQIANSLDETIVASASMVQEQAIPVVIEPQDNPETSLQTDLVSTVPVVDNPSVSAGQPEQSAVLNLNTESSGMEPRPRSDSNAKPPPIKPKKKKVPPPRPPRRSSSYLSDGIESQYSPVSDTKQRSSVLSAGSPVASQFRRSGSYASELEGSPAPETRQRHSTDHSVSHMTVASSPIISAGPPVARRPPRRSGSHLSDSVEFQGSPVLEAIRRKSADHNFPNMTASSSPVVLAGPPVAFRPPWRSGSHMSDNIELHGSPVREIKQRQNGDHSIPAGPPVASRPRCSGSHMSDNVELRGSPVGEAKRKISFDHSTSNMTVNSSPIISSGPPVATRPSRRSGSHVSDNIELQSSPVGETKQRHSSDYSNANTTAESAPTPSGTLNNKTSGYLGEDLVNVSVFSKIKAFEKT